MFKLLFVVFGSLIAVGVHLQKKDAAEFDKEAQKNGWEKVSCFGGYDVVPKNQEVWKVEVRGGNSKSNSSVTWSHPMPPHTPLVVAPKSGIAVLNEIPIKGLQLMNSEILGNIKPISAGSEEFREKYLVYGISETNKHPFLTEEIEAIFLSYNGANFMLVLFPDVLEIRLMDRNVKSQIPPLILLGQEMIAVHT